MGNEGNRESGSRPRAYLAVSFDGVQQTRGADQRLGHTHAIDAPTQDWIDHDKPATPFARFSVERKEWMSSSGQLSSLLRAKTGCPCETLRSATPQERSRPPGPYAPLPDSSLVRISSLSKRPRRAASSSNTCASQRSRCRSFRRIDGVPGTTWLGSSLTCSLGAAGMRFGGALGTVHRGRERPSQDQHRVTEAVEPVLSINGLGIRTLDQGLAGEGRHEHQEGRARQVKVGHQGLNSTEVVSRVDE